MMSDYPSTVTYKTVQKILKEHGRGNDPLAMIRVFIGMTGDHTAALMLNQIVYWSDKGKGKDGWFYKTAQEWDDELGMSYYQLKTSGKKIPSLDTKNKHENHRPCIHYRLIPEQFYADLINYLENGKILNSKDSKLEKLEIRKNENCKFEEVEKHIGTETTTETTGKRERAARRTQAHPIPEDFTVDGEMRKWAAERFPGCDVDRETEKFINHAVANDRRCVVWKRAWQNWFLNAPEKQLAGLNGARASPRTKATDAQLIAGADELLEALQSGKF
jgi:hypothetical protein